MNEFKINSYIFLDASKKLIFKMHFSKQSNLKLISKILIIFHFCFNNFKTVCLNIVLQFYFQLNFFVLNFT